MKAKKIRDIHILRRNGRWAAVWQGEVCRIQNDKRRRARVVRHADSPEHALVSLLASEILEPQKRGYMLAHAEFIVWLEQNGLMSCAGRFCLLKVAAGRTSRSRRPSGYIGNGEGSKRLVFPLASENSPGTYVAGRYQKSTERLPFAKGGRT